MDVSLLLGARVGILSSIICYLAGPSVIWRLPLTLTTLFKTHVHRSSIEENYQRWIDQQLPDIFPNASLAPGHVKGNDEKYDVALNLKYKGFRFDGRYVVRERDLPLSWSANLSHKGITPDYDYYLNLSYEKNIWNDFDPSGKIYRNLYNHSFDSQEVPPGAAAETPTGYEIMPKGIILRESFGYATITGIQIQATYKLTDSNTIVTGATYEEQKSYYKNLSANYLPDPESGYNIKLLCF